MEVFNLKCPKCEEILDYKTEENINAAICIHCEGIWMNKKELERIVGIETYLDEEYEKEEENLDQYEKFKKNRMKRLENTKKRHPLYFLIKKWFN